MPARRCSGTTPRARISASCRAPAPARTRPADPGQAIRPKQPGIRKISLIAAASHGSSGKQTPCSSDSGRASGSPPPPVIGSIRRLNSRSGAVTGQRESPPAGAGRAAVHRPGSPGRQQASAARSAPAARGIGRRRFRSPGFAIRRVTSARRARCAASPAIRTAPSPAAAATKSPSASGGNPMGSLSGRSAGSNNCTKRSARRLSSAINRTSRSPRRSDATAPAVAAKAVAAKAVAARRSAARPQASAMPRAAARPTQIPVKLPGPTVAATISSSAGFSGTARIDPIDHRQQRFGLAVRHLQLLGTQQPVAATDRNRASRSRRVDRQNQRRAPPRRPTPRASLAYLAQTACTSTTSGM